MGGGSATPQGGGGNVGEVAGYWDTVATRTADLNRSNTTILADPQLQATLDVGFYQFEPLYCFCNWYKKLNLHCFLQRDKQVRNHMESV